MSESIDIEVAYALPERQLICSLSVPLGTTAWEAVTLSGIETQFEDLVLEENPKLGIFGKAIKADHVLKSGERVEIYRPLLIDPKEVRKRRAEEARERRAQD